MVYTTDMANLEVDSFMEEVIELFYEEGNLTTGALVNKTGKSRMTVTKRLDKLRAGECVEYIDKSTALHRLVQDPRDGHELFALDKQRASGSVEGGELDNAGEDDQEGE